MLNLAWAKTFLALVETKSFQAAADQLQLAQPTVSQQIRKLEEQLGVVLVRRSRSGCEPTPAAFAFMPYATSLIRISERALTAVRTGHVRVGASSNVGIYILQPYVRRFLHDHDPELFDLVIDRNPVIAQKLDDAELDVAVMEWWDRRPGFLWKRWRSEPIVLIVPPDHPLAADRQVSKRKLAELHLLGGEPGTGTGRLLESYFADGVPPPRIALQLGSTEAVKEAVKAGLGVSLVLRSAVAEEVRNGSLRAIPIQRPALEKDLFVIWRDTGVSHISAPAFVTHLIGDGWKKPELS
jgi:DNA-binding transcriptional LysR family regulator